MYQNIPLSNAKSKELALYLSIGEKIQSGEDHNTQIISSIEFLAQETYRSGEEIMPSFAVCLSSGTGKSQLAFTLKIPALYFVHPSSLRTEAPQPIYSAFSRISRRFFRLLTEDYNTLISLVPNILYFSTDDIKESKVSFKSLGFLVKLILIVSELSLSHPSERWPKLELDASITIHISGMTFYSAAKELMALRKSQRLPVIFLDEFNLKWIKTYSCFFEILSEQPTSFPS